MAEPHRLKIIEPAQQCSARNEIVRHAEISFPAGAEHHRRQMSAGGAASHMNPRSIAAEFAGVRVDPRDRRATLAHDFRECHERGKRVVHRHHARARLSKAFGHEAGIGTIERQ
jgi:hypothetical protein